MRERFDISSLLQSAVALTTNALKLYVFGVPWKVKSGSSSTIVWSFRVIVPFIVSPGAIDIESFVTPAGTLNALELLSDVVRVTVDGLVAITTAHSASSD